MQCPKASRFNAQRCRADRVVRHHVGAHMRPELPGVCVRRNNASLARMITGATVVLLAFSFVPSTCDWRSLGSSDRSDALFHGWAHAMKKAPSVVCVAAVPPVRVTFESGSGRSQERLADVPSRPAEEHVVVLDDHMSPSEEYRELRVVEAMHRKVSPGRGSALHMAILISLAALAYSNQREFVGSRLWETTSLAYQILMLTILGLLRLGVDIWRVWMDLRFSRAVVRAKYDLALKRGSLSQRRADRQKLLASAADILGKDAVVETLSDAIVQLMK